MTVEDLRNLLSSLAEGGYKHLFSNEERREEIANAVANLNRDLLPQDEEFDLSSAVALKPLFDTYDTWATTAMYTPHVAQQHARIVQLLTDWAEADKTTLEQTEKESKLQSKK